MKTSMTAYRLGALSLLFAGGVFFEEPLHGYLVQNHSALFNFVLLYGFPVLAGFSFLAVTSGALQSADKRILHLCNGIAVVSITWLCLWVSMWFSMIHFPLSLVNLAGVGLALVLYFIGWKKSSVEQALWFLMSSGWCLAYMGWVNHYLQPDSRHLLGAGIGGLFIVLGAYLFRGEIGDKKNVSSIRALLY